MRCTRCRGLMVVDHFLDMRDDTGHLWLRVWRCVNCGTVAEPGMAGHRAVPHTFFSLLHARRATRPALERDTVPIGV